MSQKTLSAPGPDDKRLARVMDQLAKVQTARDQLNDELRKLSEILTTGRTSTVGIWHEFIRQWEERTGEVYSRHQRGKDLGCLGRLLKANTPERIHERMPLFFHSKDPFFARCGFTLAAFEKAFNGLVVPQGDLVTRNAMDTRAQLKQDGLLP